MNKDVPEMLKPFLLEALEKTKRERGRKIIRKEEFEEYMKGRPAPTFCHPIVFKNCYFKGVSFLRFVNNLDDLEVNSNVVFDNCSFYDCEIRRVSLESITFTNCDICSLSIVRSNINYMFANGFNNIDSLVMKHTYCEHFQQGFSKACNLFD